MTSLSLPLNSAKQLGRQPWLRVLFQSLYAVHTWPSYSEDESHKYRRTEWIRMWVAWHSFPPVVQCFQSWSHEVLPRYFWPIESHARCLHWMIVLSKRVLWRKHQRMESKPCQTRLSSAVLRGAPNASTQDLAQDETRIRPGNCPGLYRLPYRDVQTEILLPFPGIPCSRCSACIWNT